jgi:all-trans-retinol dehydrogenase (NAD+)
MILSLFNLFLLTLEVMNLLIRITISIGEQFVKSFVRQTRKSIDGKIVVITGAGSGVGRAIALRFAKLNAITVLWDINRVLIQLSYFNTF